MRPSASTQLRNGDLVFMCTMGGLTYLPGINSCMWNSPLLKKISHMPVEEEINKWGSLFTTHTVATVNEQGFVCT
jgi:hypothetical protein